MQERCGSNYVCLEITVYSLHSLLLKQTTPLQYILTRLIYSGRLTAQMVRKEKIAKTITNAIVKSDETTKHHPPARGWRTFLKASFTIYAIELRQYAEEDFVRLRQTWQIDREQYEGSFENHEGTGKTALQINGTMGYSGSTFFTTSDQKYLVKSVPRHFEHSFFKEDFLPVYVKYMNENLDSLIVRIADFLEVNDAYRWSPGLLLGFAPSHHIVMENLLVGRDEGQAYGKNLTLQKGDTHDQQEGQKHQNKQTDDGQKELWK